MNLDKYLIVDVGCRGGDLVKLIKHKFSAKYIGIDPSPGAGSSLYDEFYPVAIDNVTSKEMRTFYTYPNDSGCNSLLPMNKDLVTHDKSEYNNKWYVDNNIEEGEESIVVPTISLKELLAESSSFLEIQAIHFLKIDAQGLDIHVVKSLGDILKKTYMIQIESAIISNPNAVLYKGQQTFEKDIQDMQSLGFEKWHMVDYSINKDASPEADIIFINTELLSI